MDTKTQAAQINIPAKRLLPNLPLYVQAAATMRDLTEIDKQDLLRGIGLYQSHKFTRKSAAKSYEVVWQKGAASVRHYAASKKSNNAAVFIVPSMINKSYILNLLPDQSFIGWLCKHNMDVYLFDWGVPCNDAAMSNFDAVLCDKLFDAVNAVEAAQKANSLHGLGYCMGGTLLAGMAQHFNGLFRSNIFLAAPWDFHAGDKALATAIQAGTASALQMIEAQGHLPASWIESVFAAAQIEKAVYKYIEFSRLPQEGRRAHLFVAVEDWLHDGMDLPGDIGRTCLLNWYQHNETQNGQWRIAGRAVDLSQIKAPSLVVTSENDKLVPSRSSLAMAAQISDCDIMQPLCGHIGMMTSKDAEKSLWIPLLEWIGKH